MSQESKVGFAAMNIAEFQVIKSIAANDDKPVVMLNSNLYAEAAEYPARDLYVKYMAKLEKLIGESNGIELAPFSAINKVISGAHSSSKTFTEDMFEA